MNVVTTTAYDLAPAVPGWFNHGGRILELVEQHQPKVCVELGTWLGASAIPVARAIRRWSGTLTCVDTWSGNVNEPTEASPWMLVSCARNLIYAGVGGNVRLIPSTTREAAVWWDTPIDYLYVDAAHDYESVLEDLRAWVPHVKRGGLIVGDDYNHRLFPGVKAAWDEYAGTQELTLTRYQTDPPSAADGIELIWAMV